MASGIFKLRDQLQGLASKAWSVTTPTPAFFGGSFDGSTTACYTTTNVTGFGTGDFTIEFWMYQPTTYASSVIRTLGGSSWLFYPDINGTGKFAYNIYGGAAIILSSNVLSPNVWYHVAVCRVSGTSTMYINGVNVGSATDNNNWSSVPIFIGTPNINTTCTFNGYISNLRLVNGTAVYTSNFLPPTAPLTAISGTVLLTLQDPIQNNTVIDNGPNAYSFVNYGVKSSTVYPKGWNPIFPTSLEYLVVGGGGGGGAGAGGGAGGGGVLQGLLPVDSSSTITVTVGAGGSGQLNTNGSATGTNGNSSILGSITALGGGYGGSGISASSGSSGGSGGGGACGASLPKGSPGTSGQGNAGGSAAVSSSGNGANSTGAGGGGGAGTNGLVAYADNLRAYGGNGGAGIASSISGSAVVYAGGGGGGGC